MHSTKYRLRIPQEDIQRAIDRGIKIRYVSSDDQSGLWLTNQGLYMTMEVERRGRWLQLWVITSADEDYTNANAGKTAYMVPVWELGTAALLSRRYNEFTAIVGAWLREELRGVGVCEEN